MFAYCLNNPVNRVDLSGNISADAFGLTDENLYCRDDVLGGGSGWAPAFGKVVTVAATAVAVGVAGKTTAIAITNERTEVYDFAKSLVDVALSTYNKKQPRVHHIIPPGEFSNRNPVVQANLHAAQEMIKKAGIDIASDPNNLMAISHGLHKSIHNDIYLMGVSAAILATDGTREGIYEALFYLRISIATYDSFSGGY